jgi:hypothetical protein
LSTEEEYHEEISEIYKEQAKIFLKQDCFRIFTIKRKWYYQAFLWDASQPEYIGNIIQIKIPFDDISLMILLHERLQQTQFTLLQQLSNIQEQVVQKRPDMCISSEHTGYISIRRWKDFLLSRKKNEMLHV